MMKQLLAGLLAVMTLATGYLAAEDLTQQERLFQARDRVMPALVHIQPVVKDYNTGELKKQEVVGSGVIFHQNGYVVTNYHVAGKAERIICTLNDKEQVTAEYIGGDPPTDLAVIKLNLDGYKGTIHVAEFGDSDSLQVGQYVLAMGSPLSLTRSITAGVISTKDRYFSSDVRLPTGEQTGNYNLWIQTDAAINPGNSGGPLVNLEGQVIGINSRATMFANNIGFAIPVNIVKEVTSSILETGQVMRSWIGVHAQALQELENYFGSNGEAGVLIASIDPGSPALAAGINPGDLVLAIDGLPVSARFVEELPAFYRRISRAMPGTELAFQLRRGSDTEEVRVTTRPLGDLQGEDFEAATWGFTVKGITRQMRIENQLKDTIGVYVAGVKQFDDPGGLRPGDVIISVNKQTIGGLADFTRLYGSLQQGEEEKILLQIQRGGGSRLVVVRANRKMEEGTAFHE